MRRQSLACRRAVHSLQSSTPQHIWISEELLSSTFHQFFRNSCPQQKRNGSHVPGPLEARRRAAKRRMTISAGFYPQDHLPASFDLSQLFGFRSNPKHSWKYEPPTSPKKLDPLELIVSTVEPIPQIDSHPTIESIIRRGTEYSFAPNSVPLSVSESSQTTKSFSETAFVEPDSATIAHKDTHDATSEIDSETCFEAFKSHLADGEVASGEERLRCLAKAYHGSCPKRPDAWIFNTMVLEHLVETEQDPSPILELSHASSFAIPPTSSSRIQGFLSALDTLLSKFPNCAPQLHQLYVRLANSVATATYSSTSYEDAVLFRIARSLWRTVSPTEIEERKAIMVLLRAVIQKVSICRADLASSNAKHTLQVGKKQLMFLVSTAAKDPDLVPIAKSLLECVPEATLSKLVPGTTVELAKDVTYDIRRSTEKVRVQRLHTWLQLLYQVDSQAPSPQTSSLKQATAFLAGKVFSQKSAARLRLRSVLHAVLVRTCQSEFEKDIEVTQMLQLLTTEDSPATEQEAFPINVALDALISRMQKAELPYQTLVADTLDLFICHNELDLTLRFLNVLEKRSVVIAHATSLSHLINEQIDALRHDHRKTPKAQQHAAYLIRTYQRISAVLRRISHTADSSTSSVLSSLQSRRQFQHIIERARADHALPRSVLTATEDMSTKEQVKLIHQLAHQYSIDATRTHRETWRSIYYLYRFLREYSLPIGPLFTKAVVRSSITRPLSENRFVSARRLIWVCHLVAKVEGDEVARKIESVFWDWRGDLIRHAKDVYVVAGGHRQDKASITTMKKLKLI